MTGDTRREEKRQQALARQEARNKLTPAQQLAKLDALLGKGKGAKRERARLQKLIDE
jgi:hypothetical protein